MIKQFDLGSYTSMSDGIKVVDNVSYNAITGEKYIDDEKTPVTSFITDEYFEIYKKSGLTVTSPPPRQYEGEPFETSLLKKVLDLSAKHGLKTVVSDKRIDELARKKQLIGTEFASDEELEAYVAKCIQPYCDHPAVYAFNIIDEPSYELFPVLGKLYKAIKKYRPNLRVLINLLPCIMNRFTVKSYSPNGSMITWVEDYKKYLSAFIEATGADYIMLDSYPFLAGEDGVDSRIGDYHMVTMKVAAEFCKERNLEFYCIIQSFNMDVYDRETDSLKLYYRKCDEADLYWQSNLCMAMGVRYMLNFTYFPHRGNVTTHEMFPDDGCFLRRNGEITPLYYSAQKIYAEMQKLAPVILQYKYNQSDVFAGEGIPGLKRRYLDFVKMGDTVFNGIDSVEVNQDGALFVSEMYNEEANTYGYMVTNVTNPSVKTTVHAEISLKMKKLTKYFKGVPEPVEVKDGKITLTLGPGQGVFLEMQ